MTANVQAMAQSITGMAPFWFLNGPLTREDIARELDAMRAKRITEVVLHARYGLTIPYASEQWFEIIGWCIEEAKSRGMYCWIYDEFNWPSGTAGMSVQNMDPQYMGKYLSVEIKPQSDIDLLVFEPGQFLVAARVQGGTVTRTRVLETIDIIGAMEGNWQIFNCRIKRDPFYIDTLNRTAVECFRRLTYEEYHNRFSEEFGKTIRAFFTDEPSIYWVSVGYDDTNLPYTERLFPEFEERYGYSAVANIPYLFYPGSPAAEFRVHFWRHVADLFNTNYHGTLSEWCKKHGVIYTGHNNHEEPLRYQIRFGGDMFGAMKTMDIPGVDHLGKETLGNYWISIIGHKIASSSAYFEGKTRMMSESFGVMGWDATYTNLKRVVDWQFAHGINLIVPHAFYHTIAGKMKRESPPSFFVQSPLWENFDYFSRYVERLTEMLTGGKRLAKILVLYPLSGLLSAYQTDRKTEEFQFIDNFLNSLCLELTKNHLDYELVDSDTLASAGIENNGIAIGEECYSILIVPATLHLEAAEHDMLERIAQAGVSTYFFYRATDGLLIGGSKSSSGIFFEPSEGMVAFVNRLRKGLPHEVQISGTESEDVVTLRHEKANERITFMVNRTEKARRVTLHVSGEVAAVLMRPEDGATSRLMLSEEGTTELDFAPYQSVFVITRSLPPAEALNSMAQPREALPTEIDLAPMRNVASIYQFVYASEGNRRSVDVRESPAVMPVNWDPNPPDFSQFAGEYTAHFYLDADSTGLELVVDREYESYKIYLNGEEIVLTPAQRWVVDPMDLSASVGHLLRQGKNEIKVLTDSKLSEPLRLVGDFDISIKDDTVRLDPPGIRRNPFKLEETLPFYSGTVSYRMTFEIDGEPAMVLLDLGDVNDAATVIINGEEAGRRLWGPYELDVTRSLRSGKNEVEIVVRNSMANLMLGEPRPLGLRKPPIMRVWEHVT